MKRRVEGARALLSWGVGSLKVASERFRRRVNVTSGPSNYSEHQPVLTPRRLERVQGCALSSVTNSSQTSINTYKLIAHQLTWPHSVGAPKISHHQYALPKYGKGFCSQSVQSHIVRRRRRRASCSLSSRASRCRRARVVVLPALTTVAVRIASEPSMSCSSTGSHEDHDRRCADQAGSHAVHVDGRLRRPTGGDTRGVVERECLGVC